MKEWIGHVWKANSWMCYLTLDSLDFSRWPWKDICLAFFNEHLRKVYVTVQITRSIPWVLPSDLGPYILRMGLFTDNDFAQISVEIQRILISASLWSISPQSEHTFFQFWSGCQDVWCITNGLPTAIWRAAWVHSTHYSRSQTPSLI